jgi:hypothetical protein
MFTRFNYDIARTRKKAEESAYSGKYALNTPGPGIHVPFIEDPHIRMQTWGANMMTNTIHLESDLFGLTRPLNRDLPGLNDYKKNTVPTSHVLYGNQHPFVEETRASDPAWMYRELEQPRWEKPFINPQNNLDKPFHDNIQTRILEKDYYVPGK